MPACKSPKGARAERAAFRTLPVHLARKISFFLNPFQLSHTSTLLELLAEYPLPYLSVGLTVPKTRKELDAFATIVSDGARVVLDVTLYGLRGEFALPFACLLLRSTVVEGFTVVDANASLRTVELLSDHVAGSRNSSHFFHLSFSKEELAAEDAANNGAKAIAKIVRDDSRLCCLDLKCSGLKFPCQVVHDCGLLAALSATTSLCYLQLANAGLDPEGAVLLADVLQANSSIEYVHLGENYLGDKGVLALAKVLESNTSLRALKLPLVGVTAVGGKALAKSLCRNNCLRQLHMKDDTLGPECGRAFADMLKVNSTLRFLCLDFCDLQADGCKHFVPAIAVNRTLEVLRLNFNGITVEDQFELKRQAEEGGVLSELEVCDRNLLVKVASANCNRSLAQQIEPWNRSYASHLISRRDRNRTF